MRFYQLSSYSSSFLFLFAYLPTYPPKYLPSTDIYLPIYCYSTLLLVYPSVFCCYWSVLSSLFLVLLYFFCSLPAYLLTNFSFCLLLLFASIINSFWSCFFIFVPFPPTYSCTYLPTFLPVCLYMPSYSSVRLLSRLSFVCVIFINFLLMPYFLLPRI